MFVLIVLFLGVLPVLPQQSPINPKAVALLRWYPANLTTSFPVGSGAVGVAFDGANIWVTNADDGTVTKLRPSDGANLGTFRVGPYPWGQAPWAMAFDGANIWVVTGYYYGRVSKM